MHRFRTALKLLPLRQVVADLRTEAATPATCSILTRGFATDKSKDKKDKKDDLIKCPEGVKVSKCPPLNLKEPPPPPYDIGYCKPPCKPPLFSCPPNAGKSGKKKKKVCCPLKNKVYQLHPCKNLPKDDKCTKSKESK